MYFKCSTNAFKENTKLHENMDERQDLRQRFFYIALFSISFSPLTFLRPAALRLLHVANAHFQRDYNTYLSEAELHGYYAWGTTQKSASGEHIAVCLNHHQRLGVTS